MIRVDLYDNSDNHLASTYRALNASVVEQLDAATEVSFTVPASDAAAQYLTMGNYGKLADDRGVVVEFGIYNLPDRTIIADAPAWQIKTLSRFGDLNYVHAEDSTFISVAAGTVLGTGAGTPPGLLYNISPAWSLDIEAGVTAVTVTQQFAGESIARAVNMIVERLTYDSATVHWYEDAQVKTLYVGQFGADNGTVLANPSAFAPTGDTASSVVWISQLTDTGANEVINSLDVIGGSDGNNFVTLPGSAPGGGVYAVQSRASRMGGTLYYIEDATSIASYGTRRRYWQDSTANTRELTLAQAETALYWAAQAALLSMKDVHCNYSATCVRGAESIALGEKVRLFYAAAADNYSLITPDTVTSQNTFNINKQVYVTKKSTSWDVAGNRQIQLELAEAASPYVTIPTTARVFSQLLLVGGSRSTRRVITEGALAYLAEHDLNPATGPHIATRVEMSGHALIDEGATIPDGYITYDGDGHVETVSEFEDGEYHKWTLTWTSGKVTQIVEEYPLGTPRATWTPQWSTDTCVGIVRV